MQLVRTAQPKHKINLLSLSTEAGGPDVGHLVCSINSMQFVRTAQFKHKHLLALYSHSPRRTGAPQAPASGALVYIYIYISGAQALQQLDVIRQIQVNGYTFENKTNACGTSVPIESLHNAPETPARGLRG